MTPEKTIKFLPIFLDQIRNRKKWKTRRPDPTYKGPKYFVGDVIRVEGTDIRIRIIGVRRYTFLPDVDLVAEGFGTSDEDITRFFKLWKELYDEKYGEKGAYGPGWEYEFWPVEETP